MSRHRPTTNARRIFRAAAPPAVLLAALLPGGCVAALGAGTFAGTLSATGKTPMDHAYSLATGKDCSLVRKQRGLTYCIEDESVVEQALHCYPTLGETMCYRSPDPYPGGQRAIGAPPRLAGDDVGGQTARTPSNTN
jgi:hypothetical protein